MNRKLILTLLIMLLLSLSGCQSISNAKTSTIHIDKKGQVSSITVESLPAEQYQEEDLKALVEQTIADYNAKEDSKSITLDKLSVKKEQARLIMKYNSVTDYEKFNGRILFAGTVIAAKEAGYDFSIDFIDVDKASIKGSDIIINDKEARIVITNEPVQVQTLKDILYVSPNVTIVDKRIAQVEAEGTATDNGITFGNSEYAYIIYQKQN